MKKCYVFLGMDRHIEPFIELYDSKLKAVEAAIEFIPIEYVNDELQQELSRGLDDNDPDIFAEYGIEGDYVTVFEREVL